MPLVGVYPRVMGMRVRIGNERKLDKAFVNVHFINRFKMVRLEYLVRKTLDHKPMLIFLSNRSDRYGPSHFRYQNMWNSHENFPNFLWRFGRNMCMDRVLIGWPQSLKNLKSL